ncbi:hypothetical protein AB0B50_21800 [Streptomyces sp. NPDC041068]|uniref:hypothetical protein n=1 Tax=Streptomyces sp. NPDC041068 TaxID=3155130 RepID=UPI003407A1B5
MARLTWETKAGRVVLSSCGALVALALIAGGYYWWGGPRERGEARQVLAEACEGVLAADETRAVLGDGPYNSGPGRPDVTYAARAARGGAKTVSCDVSRRTEHGAGHPTHDASVEVSVQRVPEREAADRPPRDSELGSGYGPLYPAVSTELPPAALGGGWHGLFTTGEGFSSAAGGESATTAVLMDCARDRGSLLVTVAVGKEVGTLDDPRERTAYARIATATATKASEKWDCDAKPGRPLRTVGLPVNADEDVPLADASGSCRGLPGRGSRASRAWESEVSGAPVEVCVVAGGRVGTPVVRSAERTRIFRLVASFGPYAENERGGHRERDGGYGLSAVCRGGGGPALFTVRADEAEERTSAADRDYERAALKAFAERSARAHGCEAPKRVDVG